MVASTYIRKIGVGNRNWLQLSRGQTILACLGIHRWPVKPEHCSLGLSEKVVLSRTVTGDGTELYLYGHNPRTLKVLGTNHYRTIFLEGVLFY